MEDALPVYSRPRSRSDRPAKIAMWIAVIFLAIVMIVPFVFMLVISLDMDAKTAVPFPPRIIPGDFGWDSYRIAIQSIDIWRLYLNTFEIAVVQIIISLASALLAAYALSKLKPKGGNVILLLALSTMMIPTESTIIPNFLLFKRLHLLDTYWAFWLPALAYPFGTFLIKQYMDGLPSELREAAILDGAGELRVLYSIYLPLCKGALAVLSILLYLAIWNDFLWPLLVLSDSTKFTIQLGIASFNQTIGGQQYALPSVNMAAAVLSLLPVLAIYLFFQRYIVENIAVTGVKG
ncbi:MAG: carbohydrate ABC transporter permease [Thermomicrobiales bacterium]